MGEAALRGAKAALGDKEAVGCDCEAGVMMKAAPVAALVMAEADLLLEVLVIAFDHPARLGGVHQALERGRRWQVGRFRCKVRFPSQFAMEKLHELNALCVAYPVQKQTLQLNPLLAGKRDIDATRSKCQPNPLCRRQAIDHHAILVAECCRRAATSNGCAR